MLSVTRSRQTFKATFFINCTELRISTLPHQDQEEGIKACSPMVHILCHHISVKIGTCRRHKLQVLSLACLFHVLNHTLRIKSKMPHGSFPAYRWPEPGSSDAGCYWLVLFYVMSLKICSIFSLDEAKPSDTIFFFFSFT